MRARRLVSSVVPALVLVATGGAVATATGPGGWGHIGHGMTPTTPSLNGSVYALNTDKTGVLLVGGSFTAAGGIAAANDIAKWDGSGWSAVSSAGSQLNGGVNAIAYDPSTGNIYAGGNFTNAGGNADADFVAVSNGTTWSPVCAHSVPLVTASVFALQIIGRTLYVGGSFADGGGLSSADRLVACNLDTGAVSSTVVNASFEFNGSGIYALTADSNGVLYAGGSFLNLEGIAAADHVAYRDGSGWHAMGSGGGTCGCAVDDYVRSLKAVGTNIYVGTDAKDVAGIAQADNVAKWDGSTWSALGSATGGADGWFPTSTSINGLLSIGSDLYAAGNFVNANGNSTADEIARFDGSAWHPVGSNGAGNGPLDARATAIVGFDGRLFAGGTFSSAGGDAQAHGLAAYPGYVPVCTSLSFGSATGGVALPIRLTCQDKTGLPVHYALFAGPSHGQLSPVTDGGKVTYTPTVGYQGADQFTFHGKNADGLSNIATVSINDKHPGYGNAGQNIVMQVRSLTANAGGKLSFRAYNSNGFALRVSGVRVTSTSTSQTFATASRRVTIKPERTAVIPLHLTPGTAAKLSHRGNRVLVTMTLRGPHGSHSVAGSKGTIRAPR